MKISVATFPAAHSSEGLLRITCDELCLAFLKDTNHKCKRTSSQGFLADRRFGPPACAKSMFMLQIEKFLGDRVYFAEGASTTKAGIQKFVSENPHKEIIIIDEIDKMSLKDQEGLLSMMERGEFISTKIRNTKTVKVNIVIFATSNSTERLSKPLLSRFTVFEIPEYTYEEFEGIALLSLENRQQGHKRCLENCQVMQSIRWRRGYKPTDIDTSKVS